MKTSFLMNGGIALFLFFFSFCSKAQTWSWHELGILNANNTIHALTRDNAGNIYAAGSFSNASGERYVAKWDGTTWTELGTGINGLNANNGIFTLMVDDVTGFIYAAGAFTNKIDRCYVAVWDGSSWSELGTINANNYIYTLAKDSKGNIYAAGKFTGSTGKYIVARWNGINWTDMGLNADDIIYTLHADPAGNSLYAGGNFKNTGGNVYVAHWNGTAWSELGTGAAALNANSYIYTIDRDATGNVYAAGNFTNSSGKHYVAKWDGSIWDEVGGTGAPLNASGQISNIIFDKSGNLYASGVFTNLSGKNYVAKWDGTVWSEVGTGGSALNANSYISRILADPAGRIYAAGFFTKSPMKYYVAQYGPAVSIPEVKGNTRLKLYPNPANSEVCLDLTSQQDSAPVVVKMISAEGRVVWQTKVNPGIITISMNDFPSGLYSILVDNDCLHLNTTVLKK